MFVDTRDSSKVKHSRNKVDFVFFCFPTIEQRLAENCKRSLDKYKREYESQHGRIDEDVYNNGEDEID